MGDNISLYIYIYIYSHHAKYVLCPHGNKLKINKRTSEKLSNTWELNRYKWEK